jgi:peptide/nickel transport system substrate-binding protein
MGLSSSRPSMPETNARHPPSDQYQEDHHVSTRKRSTKIAALAVGLSLIAAACGDDGGSTATTAAPETSAAPDTTGAPETTAAPDTTAPSADVAMRITIDLDPAAVWEDGSPITVADFQCTLDAALNTPGSIGTVGYDQIVSVEAGSSDQQVIVNFATLYAPYKTLFGGLIKAAAVEDCSDISADFADMNETSGRPYKLDSWSPEQAVFVPNENYWGEDTPVVDRVVMVPFADGDTQNAALLAGEVDFIYPQFYGGITAALADPNVANKVEFGSDYEGFYLQSDPNRGGPFSDPIFRQAFAMSVDRDAVFEQIYVPLADGQGSLLQCGPIVPGPYCPDDAFADQYDPAAAEALLTENGWAKNAEGYWAKDGGEAPTIRWIINTGNVRRENTQAFLIPLLQAAGFNVVPDNCDAACYFQQRLPALDYDMAMYISTAPPEPGYLTPAFACDQIPSDENGQQGQNSTGWCNEEATALLKEADVTVDVDARAALIKEALTLMAGDYVMLPLFQFPKAGFWRTDKLAGPVDGELKNYTAFVNFHQWEDVDGDGQIIIGAEQWPECLNPVTECANSSWMLWTTVAPILPGVWSTTNNDTYEITNLVTGDPLVEVL